MYEFLKKCFRIKSYFFEKNKREHTDINMLDIMYAKQEVKCLNTFETGDKNVMGVD